MSLKYMRWVESKITNVIRASSLKSTALTIESGSLFK
jgi:hypothetical protein